MKNIFQKKRIGRGVFIFFLFYIIALTFPYVPHKKVSSSFKKSFAKKSFYADQNQAGTERVAYITDNMDAFIWRLKMIEEAQDEIILSTFDFNADKSGKHMMAALLHAADRGVKVRVIVDGVSGLLDLRGDEYFQAFASHENISLKVYNPVHLLKPWDIQARLHDKYLIIDDSMYLLGGRNTTNLFLGDYSSHKNIDRELFVYETQDTDTSSANAVDFSATNSTYSSSLAQVRQYFESVWELPDSKDYICKKQTKEIQKAYASLEQRYEKIMTAYPKAKTEWSWIDLTIPTNRITLLSNPIESENKAPEMWYALSQLMMTGKQVSIYTPYIICGKEMYADLKTVAQTCEKVEILTNDVSSGANPWGCTDYLNQKKKIWNTGVNVYEYLGKHSSHTKAVLIDDAMTILGSYNLDMRSTYQDTELMLAVDSPELNAMIREEIETDKTYSRIMTENGEYAYGENYKPKEMSFSKKVFYLLLRILTIPIRRFL